MLYPEMFYDDACCKASPHRWFHGFAIEPRVVVPGTFFNRKWRRHGTR